MKSVLILLDVYGWAFDFNSRGIIKYSTKFNCTAKKWDEVNAGDDEYDIIFAMNYEHVWAPLREREKWIRKNPETGLPKYCVGVRSWRWGLKDHMNIWDGIGCNNLKTYNKLRREFPDSKIIHYTPNGVDTEIFKPQVLGDRFQVGWAGFEGRGEKRTGLLKRLNYPVKIVCQRDGEYFRKDVSRQNMIDFYKSIDCLVCTSSSEGMNNVVLEACACGLPVVSTAVGDIPRLIPKEWLVPVNPPELVINEMNKKLTLLKNNLDLRREVGRMNREEAVKNWSWRKVVKYYERMFESALTKNF